MTDDFDLDFDDSPAVLDFEEAPARTPGFSLRDYQDACLVAIDDAWLTLSRILAVLATGGGKTIIFSQVTRKVVNRGGRALILAHTEELLNQAADKLFRSTGLESEREKAASRASLDAPVVIASVQTLARDARLTGFPDDHFTHVIVDEAHRSLAASYLKILNYFHYGAESLADDWKAPEPGIPYKFKARVLGVTATADRGDKRSLGLELAKHDAVDAIWYFGDATGAAEIEKASAGNLKQTWTETVVRDWSDPAISGGRDVLGHATQVKNIWIPYGE